MVYNDRGDRYSLLTVIFALVLFLAAMAERMRGRRPRRLMLGLAICGALVALAVMVTFPVWI